MAVQIVNTYFIGLKIAFEVGEEGAPFRNLQKKGGGLLGGNYGDSKGFMTALPTPTSARNVRENFEKPFY